MTDIKLPPSRSPAMEDKVEQRAWELLEAECGKPLPFDVPTHAALSAIRAALTAAHQQGQPVGDDPIDASSNAEYIEHCADRLERLGLRVTAVALRAIAHEHRALAQQPAALDGAMVERIAALLHEEATAEPWTVAGVEHPGPDRDYYRGLARKVAALVTQPGGSDNGR